MKCGIDTPSDSLCSEISTCVTEQLILPDRQRERRVKLTRRSQTGVLHSADEDVQRAVCVDRRPGGVRHKASIRGDPVDDGVGVPTGFTAQGHALTLQNFQLLKQKSMQ